MKVETSICMRLAAGVLFLGMMGAASGTESCIAEPQYKSIYYTSSGGGPPYQGYATMAAFWQAQDPGWRNTWCVLRGSMLTGYWLSTGEPDLNDPNTSYAVTCGSAPPTDRLSITLAGPSFTKALPAGFGLPQIARVRSNGEPVTGIAVSIAIAGTSSGVLSGSTDSRGEFEFIYVPPYLRATRDTLTGDCPGCCEAATKSITVEACDICSAPDQ